MAPSYVVKVSEGFSDWVLFSVHARFVNVIVLSPHKYHQQETGLFIELRLERTQARCIFTFEGFDTSSVSSAENVPSQKPMQD